MNVFELQQTNYHQSYFLFKYPISSKFRIKMSFKKKKNMSIHFLDFLVVIFNVEKLEY